MSAGSRSDTVPPTSCALGAVAVAAIKALRDKGNEIDLAALRGLVKALDMLDEVIALIRNSPDVSEAREGLMGLLEIDELQATAILDMQLRQLAALQRQCRNGYVDPSLIQYAVRLASATRQPERYGVQALGAQVQVPSIVVESPLHWMLVRPPPGLHGQAILLPVPSS